MGAKRSYGDSRLAGLAMLRVRGFGEILLFYRETPEGIGRFACSTPQARDIGVALGEEAVTRGQRRW